jgi:hypothetical protein
MFTIICLGKKACDIGEIFEDQKQYLVKLIDIDIEGENCFALQKQNSPEAYEENTPDMSSFFKDVTENVIFITTGDCQIVSSSLRILKQIKDKKIHVAYIRPSNDFITHKGLLEDKIVFNVLQQYTRSGIFEKMFIFDDVSVENILSDVSIDEYENKYNELIYNSITNFIKLKDTEAIIDNSYQPSEVARIVTFGFYDLLSNKENFFYSLNNIEYKIYNFFFNQEKIKSDKSLHKDIKEKIKNKNQDYTKNSYSIRSISSEQSFCYVIAYSKFIQP